MNASSPAWGEGSKFYLPNEDTAVVRMALRLFRARVRRPVFVGGSGMALLEGASVLARPESITFVDLADFQLDYFLCLLRAIEQTSSPAQLREWFSGQVYPELCHHFAQRGLEISCGQVLQALLRRFGVDFFFKETALARVRRLLPHIESERCGIVSHLARSGTRHDFIYLSNVPDYLPEAELDALAAACARHEAPVYLLLTSACADARRAAAAFAQAGFAEHPVTGQLNARNRGLGSPSLVNAWNRPGRIHLYVPNQCRGIHA